MRRKYEWIDSSVSTPKMERGTNYYIPDTLCLMWDENSQLVLTGYFDHEKRKFRADDEEINNDKLNITHWLPEAESEYWNDEWIDIEKVLPLENTRCIMEDLWWKEKVSEENSIQGEDSVECVEALIGTFRDGSFHAEEDHKGNYGLNIQRWMPLPSRPK